MKIIKTFKKLLKKTIKLFFKGAKVYYRAKLKGIKLSKALNGPDVEIAGIPVNDVVQIADSIQTLLRTVRNSHKLPEDKKIQISIAEDGDEAFLKFDDERGISWEYEVSRSDYEKIEQKDLN